jgi:ComF family protein
MSVFSTIINEIDAFPCVYCGLVLPARLGFCEGCYKLIPFIKQPLCPACGAENDGIFELCGKCLQEEKRVWSQAVAVMRMEGVGREMIHRFKYGKETAIARALGNIAAKVWQDLTEDADIIVPTPLHWSRKLLRGYNQSELFANIFSTQTNIPCKNILRRVKMTSKQATLNREQRKKNLIKAFSVKKEAICRNSTILLVDDVMTTGATLSSAASALLDAGAKNVKVLVLARA